MVYKKRINSSMNKWNCNNEVKNWSKHNSQSKAKQSLEKKEFTNKIADTVMLIKLCIWTTYREHRWAEETKSKWWKTNNLDMRRNIGFHYIKQNIINNIISIERYLRNMWHIQRKFDKVAAKKLEKQAWIHVTSHNWFAFHWTIKCIDGK
jgi:hypothetical protein